MVVLLVAALLLAGLGSDAASQAQATPQGKLAIALAHKRGFLVTDLQGHVQRTISLPRGRSAIGAPQFSANGARLWFLVGGPGLRKRLWLHVAPSVGQARGRSYTLRVRGSDYSSLHVSADGRRVAVGTLSKNSKGCGSFVVVSSTGRTLRSFEGGAGIELRAERWSPDGTRLLYSRHDWGTADWCGKFSSSGSLLMVGGRGAGPAKRLSTQSHGLLGPAFWSPDARRVALYQLDQRGDLGKCPLYLIEASSGKRRLVAPDSSPGRIAWPAATGEIVASRVSPNEGIWAFDPKSDRRRPLVAAAGVEASSADGNRLGIYRSEAPHGGVLDSKTGSFWPFPPATQRRFPRFEGPAAYFLR